MKRIFILLLIACSAFTPISADPTASPQKKPESVIATLNAIIQKFGNNSGQTYSVNRNPNTGITESSIKIVPFRCPTNQIQNDNVLNAVALNFPKDEPLSYQFQHIQPGSKQYYLLNVYTNNDADNTTLHVRTHDDQEMWFMCCKNPENPQLRDAYAITWVLSSDKKIANGMVYMVTSLRPDIYEKNFETSKKMFKIVGRVGDEIKDSLYNIYIADSREALYNLDDNEYVACVPVINKRFEWQTELTKPCVGRLRCIFPDGSLCSAWIDLDFVPGETYNITVHNGYYDEDKDYERRVGRQSGKSLIEPNAVKVVDEVPAEWHKATVVQPQNWRSSLTAQQQAKIELKTELVQMDMEKIKASYKSIGEELQGMRDHYKIGTIYETILKENKELDKKYQDVIKLVKDYAIPTIEMPSLYKEILKFYNEQNQGVNEFFKNFGYGTSAKPARKLQKYLNEQMEKYIKELENSLQ